MSKEKRRTTGVQRASAPEIADEVKESRFSIRMRPSVMKAGKHAAKLQNRSLASLMETLLILHLREHDLLPEDVQIDLRQLELRAAERSVAKAIRGARR